MLRNKKAYGKQKPFISPNFEDGNWDELFWLSSDGITQYIRRGASVYLTTTTFANKARIGDESLPEPIQMIRELSDGQLLISTNRNEDEGVPAKLFKTVGFTKENPSTTTFKEVYSVPLHEGSTRSARISNQWGGNVHENYVVMSEYGLRGDMGARYVFLSTDNGDNFEPIFDIMNTPNDIEGAETPDQNAHIHSACYDKYEDKIWIATGDVNNTGTYWSDDLGQTWHIIDDSKNYQATPILPIENKILLGSDASPNGIWEIDRQELKLKPLYNIGEEGYITHVAQMAWRRDENSPILFAFAWARGDESGQPLLVASDDGENFYTVWRDTQWLTAGSGSRGLNWVFQKDDDLLVGMMNDNRHSAPTLFKSNPPKFK